jgi:CRP-like cAMP-binding protein
MTFGDEQTRRPRGANLADMVAMPRNLLLEGLTARERQGLVRGEMPVELQAGKQLSAPGGTLSHVYFPLDGAISLVVVGGHPRTEVGLIGREGMVGMPAILGTGTRGLLAIVDIPGHAWRIDSAKFARRLDRSPALRRCMTRYVHVRLLQTAGTAACKQFHLVEMRLARWLSMSRDRAMRDELAMTHEYLSHVLGVRRAGVSLAAGQLQSRGLIRYSRGHVVVLDRRGLGKAACDCYSMDKRTYERVMR